MARNVRQIRRKGKHVGIASVPPTAAPDFDTRMALDPSADSGGARTSTRGAEERSDMAGRRAVRP